jgi:hypothetical protein
MTRYSIPEDIEAEVVRELYIKAAELNWTHITDQERTKHYRIWTDDPTIGERLLPFVSAPQNVRPWIKDGPMKEYVRATYGVGKYAPYVVKPATPVTTLVTKALGPGWTANLDTLTIKPLTVIIRNDRNEGLEQCFTWGPAKDIKHLVWATIQAQAKGDTLPRVLCLIYTFVRPVSPSKKVFNMKIGALLGITIKHVADG